MNNMNIQDISIENIIPYARNPRKNDDAITKVASSIKEYGFKQPIVVDKDMVIIAGHTRYQAAKKLGYETVPVLIANDLTEAQAKAYRIADNKTGEYAEWDYDLLKLEFDELVDIDFDLSETGFIKNELEDILNINDDEDKYTTKITTPIYEITGIKPNITDLY
jgi:ParB-like chromosome segregation protein Spo0J